jgi:transketolase
VRVNFCRSIQRIFAQDAQAVFLTGDLGFGALETLRDAYPKRFFNAGVAEQNMMGMAAGLALAGYRPWIYSIAPFAVYRCFEQIRNDVCLHNLTVRIVGNGGGYTYGIMGSTHHALEDLGILKTLPNMQLYFPCTNDHVDAAMEKIQATPGPAYLRLGICGYSGQSTPQQQVPHSLTQVFGDAAKITVLAIGQATGLALSLAELVEPKTLQIFGLARFPFALREETELLHSLQRTGRLLLIDEHYPTGSLTETLLAELPHVPHVRRACATYTSGQRYGSSRFHLGQAGLAPDALKKHVDALLAA